MRFESACSDSVNNETFVCEPASVQNQVDPYLVRFGKLGHLSFQQVPYYDTTNKLSHYEGPYPNKPEGTNSFSTAWLDQHPTLPELAAEYHGQPRIPAFGANIPNQMFPSIYQRNYQVPHFFGSNRYLSETQVNSQLSQMYRNEMPQRTTDYFHAFNDCNNLHQMTHICQIPCPPPLSHINGTIPREMAGSLENSGAHARFSLPGAQRLVHLPFSAHIKDPRRNFCFHESNVTTFPEFHEKFNAEETKRLAKTDERQGSVNEASLPEGPEGLSQQVSSGEFRGSAADKRRATRFGKLECPTCGRKLARASTLKIHMRQHSGDRPFKCPLCTKSFAQQTLLQSHLRKHNGERPYVCTICPKSFAHSSAIKTHMRTHTGERPHKCPVPNCGLAFSDSSTLSKHSRVHSGKRPYTCNICGKRFTQSGNMNKHRKTMHKVANAFSMDKIPVLEKDMTLSEIYGDNENVCTATTEIPMVRFTEFHEHAVLSSRH